MPYDLNPDEVLAYGNRRRQATSNWASQTNALNYRANIADQNYGQQVGAQTRNWQRSRERLPGSFANRGLQTSGLYGRALSDFNTQRDESFGQLARDYYNQRAQFGMERSGLDQQYWNEMANIDDQERLRRAQIAAQLTGAY